MPQYKKLTFGQVVAATAKFALSEIGQQVRKVVPGFMDLWRVFDMSEDEIAEDRKRLRKEMLRNELRQAGYGREVRTWGIPERERQPREDGPLSAAIRSAARRR